MKLIEQMNLAECIEALHSDMEIEVFDGAGEWRLSYTRLANVADRIHDLTRWIPVSERMPTKEDGDSMGLVFVWHDTSSPLLKGHGYVAHYHWVPASDEGITHWKRITPPTP